MWTSSSHRPDPDTPLEETLGALDHAVRVGKALYTGISSYSGEDTRRVAVLCEANGWHRPIIHQPNYSMLNRAIESDLLPVTSAVGMGTIAFCPLAQGLLTGKYLDAVPSDSRAKQASGALPESAVSTDLVAKLKRLNDIAASRSQTLAQLALCWAVREQQGGPVTSALIGASRPEQIAENVAAFEVPTLGASELAEIDTILAS